ncbi:kinase-like protein [Rhizopogon salebrosus TDB-379]|nr:kinase-like protein [Rhizopogon salebrosus TDB-379]
MLGTRSHPKEAFLLGPFTVPRVWVGLWQLSSNARGSTSAAKVRQAMHSHAKLGYHSFDMQNVQPAVEPAVPTHFVKRRGLPFFHKAPSIFDTARTFFQHSVSLFKTLAKFFRRNVSRMRQAQSPSLDDEAWNHQRIFDLTGQLCNIPQYPTVSGGYGDVWKCDLIKDGSVLKVAVKAIRRQGESDDDAFTKAIKKGKRELEVWMKLRHDHVLPLYGIAHEFRPGTIVMVCPWLENGTVTSFIGSRRDLSASHRSQLIGDVAVGLHYLHSKCIVHGDLTGSNILVCAQERAHIADFGLSVMLAEDGDDKLSHSLTGAARWAAPELTLLTGYTDARHLLSLQSDMYSFGSIMFHILSGIMPYHGLSNNQVIGAIARGKRPLRPENVQINDRHWNFIQRCWLPFEERLFRPSADDACDFLQYEPGHSN